MAHAVGRPCDGRVESGMGLKVARSFACPGFAVGHATHPVSLYRRQYLYFGGRDWSAVWLACFSFDRRCPSHAVACGRRHATESSGFGAACVDE
jgi:hypothetical protein